MSIWNDLDPVQKSLLLIVAAAVALYVGVRLLWAAVPWPGVWRGVAVAVPVILFATQQAGASPGTGVAMLISAAVLTLTLGLGVSLIDLPDGEVEGAQALRAMLPIAATVCLAGFHGELSWRLALAILIVGVLSLWTASGAGVIAKSDEVATDRPAQLSPATGIPAVVLILGGLFLLAAATGRFRLATGHAAVTPVVVLLTVPAILLAVVGLLASESRQRAQAPHETIVGFAIACLGLGLPLVIAVGTLWPYAAARIAATQPTLAPVIMPLATWRIDSVLLLVVSGFLLPIGAGRLKVGRLEGAGLVVLYLAYAAVATRAIAFAG